MKLTLCLAAALATVACTRSDQSQSIVFDGLAYVDGDGNIHVLDTSNHRWFGVYPDKAANIAPAIASFRSTYKDHCWVRVYGVRASGTIFGKDLLRTKSISIRENYSDAEVPAILDRVEFQALKGKHTCGSA